ncbi:hypothetical protein ACIQYS_14500 [Psychrobacillus sp. NPDC096426]|uniref:hypothetical protein n=1 Tax=Psychrobacillus sp. NPDC096426 TaxID=3364491 RepID=UPI0038065DCA
MEKTKYTFRHFFIVDGQKKEIDPLKEPKVSNQCKLLWANLTTGKEHVLVEEENQYELPH